jgi:hypothetical protein
MIAGRYNFIIEQGSTLDFTIEYKDSNGEYVDLTNYSAALQIRPCVADKTEIIYLTLSSSLQSDGSGLILAEETSGSIQVYLSAVSSSLLDFDEAVYDLEIYSGSFAQRLLEGRVKFSREVTRI